MTSHGGDSKTGHSSGLSASPRTQVLASPLLFLPWVCWPHPPQPALGAQAGPCLPSITEASSGKRSFPSLFFIFISKGRLSHHPSAAFSCAIGPGQIARPPLSLPPATEAGSCLLAAPPSADLTWQKVPGNGRLHLSAHLSLKHNNCSYNFSLH